MAAYKKTSFYKPSPHHKYSTKERREALETFSVALLMVRDTSYEGGVISANRLTTIESMVEDLAEHSELCNRHTGGAELKFLTKLHARRSTLHSNLQDLENGFQQKVNEISAANKVYPYDEAD